MKRLLAAAALFLLPAIAHAEGWHHAAAPMGQYEGGYEGADGAFVYYSCGLGKHVSIGAPGMHAAKGKAQLLVDGKPVYEGAIAYSSAQDATSVAFDADAGAMEWKQEEVGKIIDAIAKGSEMVLVSPNGERFTYPLKGSAQIRSCR
ncbi:hypothetical protein LAZ40_11010 [Cereibacter sphaeroides]|uniref:hypothetical protein n=1 Tax=Cereibacter sphaeroides TaxID=1063 RepID=UPI001F344827|nr:hypothetical protein [Cereibacter sphaeroides]MCE6959585.1 hypothetical protein [Cereibacter sphaeroides]MCE6974555.1 hypothetical protein [Cereibacter sphaeroides]